MAGNQRELRLFGLNGDPWALPESTPTGYWSALGAGADGLCLDVHLTKDRQALCIPHASLQPTCGDERQVDAVTLAEIQSACDAGATWNSTLLDEALQPAGEQGSGLPWKGCAREQHPKKPYLRHPALEEMLRLFGRRTGVCVRLPGGDYPHRQELARIASGLLETFGLTQRVPLIADPATCAYLRDANYSGLLVPDIREAGDEGPERAAGLPGIRTLFVDLEWLLSRAGARLPDVDWLVTSRHPWAPVPAELQQVLDSGLSIQGLVTRAVLPVREYLRPPFEVFADDFAGTEFDTQHWSAGYSHQNRETTITHNDGISIELIECTQYSGAAAVYNLPVHGDFDVQVDFDVSSPQQGTTFEVAAIGIDPGYHHPDNRGLDSRTVNLTFDVHGAPPYASSERDQDNGFRCGWNNSFNFAKLDCSWDAASANMYNKYGRDVGEGAADYPDGQLRLVRHGSVFNSYYRDRFNPAWVCSGSMLVQNLPPDAFIRLAGKHWHKISGRPTPANRIRFNRFRLRQY